MNTPQGPQPYRHNQPPPPHRHPPPAAPASCPVPLPAAASQQFRSHRRRRRSSVAPRRRHRSTGQPRARPSRAAAEPVRPAGDGIVVNTQFFPLAWVLFFVKPKIAVDGQETQAPSLGCARIVPARPGQHHVHVHVPYFLPPKLGPADATVDVRPGQVAELEYKAPMWAFSAGSLGVGPQKYNGVGITIAIVAIPFVLVFLLILFFVVLAVI